jgi:hypothetical protein
MQTKAIITIVQNGNRFFPIWYKHYSKYFQPQDIYILNFGTTDGSLDGIQANIIPIADHSVEIVHQGNKLLNEFKTDLLKKYTYVVYADYDEIIYYPGGFDALLGSNQEYYTTRGYEVVQNRKMEGVIDWNRPILEQRKYWYRCESFDKSLITKTDFTWAMGNHSISRQKVIEKKRRTGNGMEAGVSSRRVENIVLKPKFVPDLVLLHLHKVDYNHALALHTSHANKKNSATNGGFHNFFGGKEFEGWYKEAENKLVVIPESLRNNRVV